MYPDVAKSDMDPWRHYILYGKKEGRDNGLHPKEEQFFAEGYLEMYPDVARSDMDPWRHYILYGKKEGRDNGNHPSDKIFCSEGYLERYPDVENAGVDPWRHYVRYGKEEGRDNGQRYQDEYNAVKNSRYFDRIFYKNTYTDLFMDDSVDPVKHYLCYGYHENRNPSASFNTAEYVKFFKLGWAVNPLVHYEETGKFDGCRGLVELMCDGV